MYKKILVAYDGARISEGALHRGSDLARLYKAELHIVGIREAQIYSAIGEGLAAVDIWQSEQQALEDALSNAALKLSGQGLKPTTSIRMGNAAHEIAACAQELNADLIVIGHSEKGVLERWLEGSVGAGLLKGLPCDLLVATAKA